MYDLLDFDDPQQVAEYAGDISRHIK
jgi:hypothetical protein